MYEIDFKPAALRELRKLARRITRSDWTRLEQAIDDLRANPRPGGIVKLSGTDFYRIRVGDYRVIYVIDDEERSVTITKVARRTETTYR
ncbi:MAG: type II toxin-antitoxin system RelE/ParE family toxin [Anaerolineae bacterium]|nr:type II toxin-antitoxin system RelE/ParE family toxin [Anaerolineae bacterium]